MATTISAKDLTTLMQAKSKFALIDVREVGEYNSSHISDSSLIPRKELEFRMEVSAPVKSEKIVICDDNGRRAGLAAATLERMGYSDVSAFCEASDEFNPRRQRAVRQVPASQVDRVGRIATRVGPGFERGGQILQKERVAIFVQSGDDEDCESPDEDDLEPTPTKRDEA